MSYSDAEIARMMAAPVEAASRWSEWCAERGHPGTTFNPWFDLTWCACGAVVTAGDTATHDLCCGHLKPALDNDQTSAPEQLSLLDGAA